MRIRRLGVVLVVGMLLVLPSPYVSAHWCDDLWSSGYDIVVRPDSDTSPKQLYVQNRWGYQLTNFKLTATSSTGGSIALTPPTTLKVANTLLPGEKGIWKIASGNPAKIEDLTFDVTFGDTSGPNPKQWACYPVAGANPVMVVKNDGSLFPTAITGIEDPKSNTARGCSFGDVGLGTSLQDQTIADWEDVDLGLDKLLQIYCSGRGSWGTVGPPGSSAGQNVSPAYCKDTASTTCPTTKPMASPGSRTDYMHLWAAGALAIRKAALGARLPVLRERLKCGANDADPGIGGFPLFVLGYLGDDAGVKSFLQTQASASGDIGTIAKAGLYLMGDTSQKSAVQAAVKSGSGWGKIACAGALGIVDKDDAAVESALIPEVKWNEPDAPNGDGGKAMFAAHILEIVAFDRRGWVFRANADGPVTFYGETSTGAGGTSGSGGATANQDGGSDLRSGTGGVVSNGGRTGGSGPGGSPGVGGSTNSSGHGSEPQGTGGATDSSAVGGTDGSGGSGASTGSTTTSTSAGGATGAVDGEQGSGCKCNLGGRPMVSALSLLALTGLALLLVRRRRL